MDLTSEVTETSVVDLTNNDSVVVSLRIIFSCACGYFNLLRVVGTF